MLKGTIIEALEENSISRKIMFILQMNSQVSSS